MRRHCSISDYKNCLHSCSLSKHNYTFDLHRSLETVPITTSGCLYETKRISDQFRRDTQRRVDVHFCEVLHNTKLACLLHLAQTVSGCTVVTIHRVFKLYRVKTANKERRRPDFSGLVYRNFITLYVGYSSYFRLSSKQALTSKQI